MCVKESVQKGLVAEIGATQDEINVCDLAVDCTKVCLGLSLIHI